MHQLPKGVVPSKELLTTPPTDCWRTSVSPTDLDPALHQDNSVPSCVVQNFDPPNVTQSSVPTGSGVKRGLSPDCTTTHPSTSAVPYFLYPDLDLAYDSHHQLHDDDPYWHRSPVDLDAVYIYDSDEDLSMYDDPPPMGDCPSDFFPSSTLPRPQRSNYPTREGLLD